MKIVEVEVCGLDIPSAEEKGPEPWRKPWNQTFRQATPRDKFDPPLPRVEPGGQYWVKVTVEDGKLKVEFDGSFGSESQGTRSLRACCQRQIGTFPIS